MHVSRENYICTLTPGVLLEKTGHKKPYATRDVHRGALFTNRKTGSND